MCAARTDFITARGGCCNMRIMRVDLRNLKKNPKPLCACIGYFDGLHRGHQQLLARTRQLAAKHGCETAMITFEPDPWVVIRGMQKVKHITTMRQRINKAVELGMDNIVLLEFTRDMSELPPEDFLSRVLGSLNLKALVCGFDFHFAYHGQGDAAFLQAYAPFEVDVISAIGDEQGKISSTRISQCIVEGRIEEANRMLGYRYALEGKVVHGKHRGTGMGFPTANVQYDEEYLLPKNGVYAALAVTGRQSCPAMVNIGINPTFSDVDHISVEANLLDFDGDLYGRWVRLEFCSYLRGERKFRSKENLIMQLEQDQRDVRAYFQNHE